MRQWRIEIWNGPGRGWVKCDVAFSRRNAERQLRTLAELWLGRYRIVNPDGKAVFHRGTVKG
jgi:hypothetical protein